MSYFIYATEQDNESAPGSFADTPTAEAQAKMLYPTGEWVIKDSSRTVVARWDGSTS